MVQVGKHAVGRRAEVQLQATGQDPGAGYNSCSRSVIWKSTSCANVGTAGIEIFFSEMMKVSVTNAGLRKSAAEFFTENGHTTNRRCKYSLVCLVFYNHFWSCMN